MLAARVMAQTPGACTPQAVATLDAGNVRTFIFNDGSLFFNPSAGSRYEVPKDSSQSSLFSASFWIGGVVSGQLRLAAATYGDFEFRPGPLDDDGRPPADCAAYDRVWSVSREDLVRLQTTGEVSDALQDWPWDLGAPVLDGDGVPGNYNLEGGDRPALIGGQTLWWVMNDAAAEHASTATPPLPMEVRGTAFAYDAPAPLGDATFYQYRLTYRGDAPLESAYVGLFVDPDLGDPHDDYVGADTTLEMGFAYNEAAFDGSSSDPSAYGERPPAVGVMIAQGPAVDGSPGAPRLGMTTFIGWTDKRIGYIGWPEDGEPETYYHFMQGRTMNGDPVTEGGDGASPLTDVPVTVMYPGDPVTGAYWSMENVEPTGEGDGGGARRAFGDDQKMFLFAGPFTMQPGDEQVIRFVIPWAQGTDRLDSVVRLRDAAAVFREDGDLLFAPDSALIITSTLIITPPPEATVPLGVAQNYPNPFTGATTIPYSTPVPVHVRIRVFDLLGRERATLVDAERVGEHEVVFDATGLPPGVYFYRAEIGPTVATKRMVRVR